MIERVIRLNSIDDIKKFVEITASKDFSITLKSGDILVNAKVITEIFQLDLTKSLILCADCKSAAELHQLEVFCKG